MGSTLLGFDVGAIFVANTNPAKLNVHAAYTMLTVKMNATIKEFNSKPIRLNEKINIKTLRFDQRK